MDIDQLYGAALAAQKSGQEAEAERLYRQILEQASPPEVLVNLGNLLARQGRRDEALPLYDKALAARPDFLEALFNRAGLLLDMKRPDAALENYDRLVALRPDLICTDPTSCTIKNGTGVYMAEGGFAGIGPNEQLLITHFRY